MRAHGTDRINRNEGEKMAVTFDSYCGLSCADCTYKETMNCGGCIATKGNPFHGKCEVAECAKTRGKRFCGECENILSCDILKRYSFDETNGDQGERIGNCQRIKAALVKEAREGINPVSVCGHHCDYCFMGQWCGGCRSSYNCCSYATLFEDGKCPNVKCAEAKRLSGCFECTELSDCKKGYYSKEEEYTAKATAFFIQKYGETVYTQALKNAIEDGVNYARSFDETGSVEAAFRLLEKYILPESK